MTRAFRGLLEAVFWILAFLLVWRFLAGTHHLRILGNEIVSLGNLSRPLRIAAGALLLVHVAFGVTAWRDRTLVGVMRRLAMGREGILAGTVAWIALGVTNGAARALGGLISTRHLLVSPAEQAARVLSESAHDALWALACGFPASALLWWLTGLAARDERDRSDRHVAACFSVFVLAATWGPWARMEPFEVAPVPHLLPARFVLALAAAVVAGVAAWLLPRLGGPARRPLVGTAAVGVAAGAVAATYAFTPVPAVLFGGPLPLALTRPAQSVPSGESVLLITIDTLRADHLSCYGYARSTSPSIDRLAARGTRFERAYCAMPLTDPSHTSILTGAYPRMHGILRNGTPVVGSGISSLPEWLRARGYTTGAITSRAHLHPANLGVSGFNYYSVPATEDAAPAAQTLQRAMDWLAVNGRKRYFLWVHFFDPHFPYKPPAEYAGRFVDGYRGTIDRGNNYTGSKYTPEEVPYLTGLYDAEIAYSDWAVGRLIERVWEGSGEGGRPLVILTADHGESLGELKDRYDYVFAHGEYLFESQVHVPLIVAQPGRVPEGKVVQRVVENFSVAPTIAEAVLAGSGPGDSFRCEAPSLWPFTSRADPDVPAEDIAAFVQRRYYEEPPQPYLAVEECALVTDRMKLIHNLQRGPELFDLRADPAELHDLATTDGTMMELLRGRLDEWRRRHPMAEGAFGHIPAEKLQQLQGLGYIQ